jgi:LysM repeat protein
VKVRSTFPPAQVDVKHTSGAHTLSAMPATQEVGDTQDDPFLQDAFLRDRTYGGVSRSPEQLEDEDMVEVDEGEDVYLDELLAVESLSETDQIAVYETDQVAVPEEQVEAPSVTAAPAPRPRRRTARLGQSPSTVWACALGLLVAGIAILPHLQLPWVAFAAPSLSVNGAQPAAAKGASRQASSCTWYTVASGDTLSQISARSGVSVETLATVNQIGDPNLIFTDQVLCIPSSGNASQAGAKQGVAVHGEAAFVQYVLPYARRAHADTGWPLSMILAQWGLEQGWETPRFTGYNWGNCGAVPDEPTVPGTSAPGSPSAFAYAPEPEDGLRIYLHVAHLSYYTAIAPAAQNGPDAAARALGSSPWDAGHYTDHGDPGSSLITIMQDFNLYQYDK